MTKKRLEYRLVAGEKSDYGAIVAESNNVLHAMYRDQDVFSLSKNGKMLVGSLKDGQALILDCGNEPVRLLLSGCEVDFRLDWETVTTVGLLERFLGGKVTGNGDPYGEVFEIYWEVQVAHRD